MKLHFMTRDIGPMNDYPAIGWMPPLQTGTEGLWRKYGALSCEDLPQLVLTGNKAGWSLYLASLDSGRTDSATGVGGRIIRMSLYITGTPDEANEVYPILSRYVNEVLVRKAPETFKSVLQSAVKPGDPFKWKQESESLQAVHAEMVRDVLESAASGCEFIEQATDADVRVAEGISDLAADRFLRVCASVLAGSRVGTAIALAYARLKDVQSLAAPDLLSFLSLGPEDVGKKSLITNPEMEKVVAVAQPQGGRLWLIALGIILAIMVLVICCRKGSSNSVDVSHLKETNASENSVK